MTTPQSFAFGRADLAHADDRDSFITLSRDYFGWMNGEITRHCGFSIEDIINTSLDGYVLHTVEIGGRLTPDEGGVYFLREPEGQPLAMGGLRRLPDGAAEIVRIFTRPESRGLGLGSRMVTALVHIARSLDYQTLRLDTAVFMVSAQRIYEATGFTRRAPYAGAEPPAPLQPFWLYYERPL